MKKLFYSIQNLKSKIQNRPDRFDENRLDHLGFSVASRRQLEELLEVLAQLSVPTAGIEFDPDGQGEYVCFRDPDNIQLELYVGDYHD